MSMPHGTGKREKFQNRLLGPTNLSLAHSTHYATFARLTLTRFFATFGTMEAGSSNPIPHSAAHFLGKATLCLTLSYRRPSNHPYAPTHSRGDPLGRRSRSSDMF